MYKKARQYFPRGLKQPETGFRFSTDSLLISSFVSVPAKADILDLGTGSGVIPLGIMLRNESKINSITGIDINPDMVAAAQTNINKLGFSDQIKILEGNISKPDFTPAESFDLVVSNPPYRMEGRGRSCPDTSKNTARFEVEADLDAFCKTAARLVKNRGRVCFVFLAERLIGLVNSFSLYKLEPKRMKFVHGRVDTPAKMVMVEAVKNGKTGLILEPPIILYDTDGNPTESSIDYCPFITK